MGHGAADPRGSYAIHDRPPRPGELAKPSRLTRVATSIVLMADLFRWFTNLILPSCLFTLPLHNLSCLSIRDGASPLVIGGSVHRDQHTAAMDV